MCPLLYPEAFEISETEVCVYPFCEKSKKAFSMISSFADSLLYLLLLNDLFPSFNLNDCSNFIIHFLTDNEMHFLTHSQNCKY